LLTIAVRDSVQRRQLRREGRNIEKKNLQSSVSGVTRDAAGFSNCDGRRTVFS
jgi:hypothetical protein